MRTVAVVLARGGSKGIANKNIIEFCGRPLLAWTINQCFDAGIKDVYVSTDSEEIGRAAVNCGARVIDRPTELCSDTASSESGWKHAIDVLETNSNDIDWIFAPQVTSPLRSPEDIPKALLLAESDVYDSIFSCVEVDDLFIWERFNGSLISTTYDWRNRQRRQQITTRYLENGSFYLFRPWVLKESDNRLGGTIGEVIMEKWTINEIDEPIDVAICEALMKQFVIKQDENKNG